MTAALPLVALVDDDDDLREAATQLLGLAGYQVLGFSGGVEAAQAIGADFAGIVISDVRMPQMSGVELFRLLQERDRDLPVLLISGHADVQMAVDALKAGAWDFIEKPFAPDALLAAAGRATKARRLVLENRALRRAAQGGAEQALLGETSMIRRLRAMIPVLGQSDIDLAIEGQTGTGKELFARCVHRAGARSRHRFVTVDCAVIPPAIVEKEMFARGGIISSSHRGTLFLDNLDQTGEDLQRRLAQFAEKRAIALDTRDPEAIDTRIIASMAEGRRGHVSDALYHRVAGVPLRMPPLGERRADIRLLFAHFLQKAAERLDRPAPPIDDSIHHLDTRDWPGNLRELENFAERYCLGLESHGEAASTGHKATLPERLDAFESAAILQAVQEAKGEMARAIGLLGIPRKTFYYRAKRLGLDLRSMRADIMDER
ncbi:MULTISPECIES: sigma-54-dependent transcriptional regulator [unclassified Novosphingobium]|uniref:sigma-54-dependent transcriptional regulator n=1 Tax=unclassified Novosphingobium TaxID=2644732 RepID=UPI00086C05E0|nr:MULTISPECIES: sigma-54 dependent transcriptional regulator [unclassified Novosphingobium]MBN9144387.1 sigma-54-dependent Fis family transcriptional regulator [Novosphingobium sp.]MDR6707711.1 two-component system C4-dicarboxylate transport response regulator DctD [Novosphingobium sp. 1748]ODU83956.1 MAG: Fis family transcriptional regulator [Novosphingobium sp. SCN 63-17]OJX93508.1 MAG: DNA-binding response regulator [Novosphingobium sp. 63-713]